MTSHYLDIRLRADPELPPHQLMGALYGRLHRSLRRLGSRDIGVSFPAYDHARPTLGDHLRLHGPADRLHALMETTWLVGMLDHVRLGDIAQAPAAVKHRTVSRAQAKSSADRLRRRAMKRHGLDATAATERIPAAVEQRLKLPFVHLGSRSTGQPSFPLFIRHGDLADTPARGDFSSYGLSSIATVPWF